MLSRTRSKRTACSRCCSRCHHRERLIHGPHRPLPTSTAQHLYSCPVTVSCVAVTCVGWGAPLIGALPQLALPQEQSLQFKTEKDTKYSAFRTGSKDVSTQRKMEIYWLPSAPALPNTMTHKVRALRRKGGWVKTSSRNPTNRKHGRFALAECFVAR